MILKGKIQVQVPDPLQSGLVVPKIIKVEEKVEEVKEVIDPNAKLTKA
jgi:hypothetical protein